MKLLAIITLASLFISLAGAQQLAPDSTAPMGQTFADSRSAETLRVLLVGSGSSHDFPRYFLGTDSQTLRSAGRIETAATPNLDEALALLPQADVLVFSGNHPMYGEPPFQEALRKHASEGKGIILVHAALWNHNWEGYNQRFVGGGSGGHGFGDIAVAVTGTDHPVMKGVPATFAITDESYHHEFREDAKAEVLAENGPDDRTRRPHSSVWVVRDSETRIVCMTFGHDARAHDNPVYQAILTNAVRWVSQKPNS